MARAARDAGFANAAGPIQIEPQIESPPFPSACTQSSHSDSISFSKNESESKQSARRNS